MERRRLKILQLGNFEDWAPHSTENDLRKSLLSMGHEVVPVIENRWDGDLAPLACDPGLVLWTHTHGWATSVDRIRAFLAECRARKLTVIGVHLDLWRGLKREENVGNHPFFEVDYLFTPDGGDPAFWTSRGVHHVYSPPAVLEASCYLADADPALAYDVLFAGQRDYHPEHPRAALIAWLEQTYGSRFEHIPSGFREHRLNVLYASARVVVGDTCLAGKIPGYTSDRLYESLGRGARLVYPQIPGITEDAPCRTFPAGDFEALRREIDEALDTPEDQANEERKDAIAWTKASHTYRHRLERILDMLRADGRIA